MRLVLSGLDVLGPGHCLICSAVMHAFADAASCLAAQ